MIAHGAPRFRWLAIGDGRHDARVLGLDAFEIEAAFSRRIDVQPYALARDHVNAEIGQEARKLVVAGRLGDGAMEGEILDHGPFAALQGGIDCAPCRPDRAELLSVRTLGGQTRRLHLHRQTQFHDIQDVGQGGRLRRHDAKRPG